MEHLRVRDNVKDALTDSLTGLFGLYRNKEGKTWICCNGGKFHDYETEND
jgi:hypothetical protein